jgi:hypothetical protein
MSYRSGGSRSGSGGRRSTSRAGWDDNGHGDYGRGGGAPRRSAPRPSSSRYRDDYDDWQPARQGGQGGRGWDDDAEEGWDGGRGQRKPRSSGRSGSKWLILAFAALLLVIAAAVIGVLVLPGRNSHPTGTVADDPFATFTPGATPTVPDHFKSFQSDRSKYSIIYPEAWTATSQEHTTQGQYDYIDIFALQNAPSQLLVEQAGAAAGYTDQQLIQNAVTLAQQNGVTFAKAQTQNPTQTPTQSQTPTQQIGGVTWTRQDYSVNANGTPVYLALLACHHGGRGYVIVLASSSSEFGNDDQAVFEPMLKSFIFQ